MSKRLPVSFNPKRSSIVQSFLYLMKDQEAVISALWFMPTIDRVMSQTTRDLDRLEDLILEQVA